MDRLASARVLVVGVGGVGSWCAEALVRTGVGHVTLVDDDVVAASNVNRQCPATAATIGRAKVEVMAERLREINPEAEVIALNRRYPFEQSVNLSIEQSNNRTIPEGCLVPGNLSIEQSNNRTIEQSNNRTIPEGCLVPGNRTIEQSNNRTIPEGCLVPGNRTIEQSNNRTIEQFSLVIDAIDSVDCKAQLILDAFAAGVPIVSSMGAALRTDPTKVKVVRFDKVEGDGLAKALRNRFRKLNRWPGKFPCVCSLEPVPGGRCLVPGAGCLVPGAGCFVPGNRTLEHSNNRTIPEGCLVPGAGCLVPGNRTLEHSNTRTIPEGCLVPGAGCFVPGNRTLEQSEQSNNRTIEQSEQSNTRTLEQSEQSNTRTIEQSEQSNNRTLEQSEQSNTRTLEHSNTRTIPKGSIMPVTATFGMCLAAEAIKILSRPPVRAVVSLGSNLEPRGEYLAKALAALGAFPRTRLVAASAVEETEPVDVPEEFRALKFLNQVAVFETMLEPLDFSRRMHRVEDELGRVRTVKNGPRTVDVDLIDFGGLVMDTPELTLPHPRAAERDFVTNPWKSLVRAEMKARRAAVPAEVRAAKSRELCAKLVDLLGDAKLVCCYEALKTELDLADFISACRSRGVEVVFPTPIAQSPGTPRELFDCSIVRVFDCQAPSTRHPAPGTPRELFDCSSVRVFDCQSPSTKHQAPSTNQQAPGTKRQAPSYVVARAGEVDLWICPGLAFTAAGARLGFGGGWYDRFLAAAKPDARAYGVAYGFQVLPSLPQGPFDRRLGGVVTV